MPEDNRVAVTYPYGSKGSLKVWNLEDGSLIHKFSEVENTSNIRTLSNQLILIICIKIGCIPLTYQAMEDILLEDVIKNQ